MALATGSAWNHGINSKTLAIGASSLYLKRETMTQISEQNSAQLQEHAEQIAFTRAKLAEMGRMLYERNLTDTAGGNLSCRVGELIVITPRYAGTSKRWQLTGEDVLVTDAERNILLGNGQNSRESNAHYAMHATFREYGSVVMHTHARNILVFAVAGRPLPPILESTRKYGVTPVLDFAPAHGTGLAENIIASLRGREALIKNAAAAAIAAWHGLFLMGKDMDTAFDSVERLDTNAYILLQGMAAYGPSFVDERVAAIKAEIG